MSESKFMLLEEKRKSDGVKFTLYEYKKNKGTSHHVLIDVPEESNFRDTYYLSLTSDEARAKFKKLVETAKF